MTTDLVPTLLSVDEAADLLGCNAESILDLVARGRLGAIGRGRRRRITRASVERRIQTQARKEAAK